MLETIDPGLGESVQLNAVGRGGGTAIWGTDGIWRGMEDDLT